MVVYPVKLFNVPYAAKAHEVYNFVRDGRIDDLEVFMSLHKSGPRRGSADGYAFVLLYNRSDVSKCLRLNGRKIRERAIQVDESSLDEMKTFDLMPKPTPNLFTEGAPKPYKSRFEATDPSRPSYNEYDYHPYHLENLPTNAKNYVHKRPPYEDRKYDADDYYGNQDDPLQVQYQSFDPRVATTPYPTIPGGGAMMPATITPDKSSVVSDNPYVESYTPAPKQTNSLNAIAQLPPLNGFLFLKLSPIPNGCKEKDIEKMLGGVAICKRIIFIKFEAGPHIGKSRGEVLVEVSSQKDVDLILSLNSLFIGSTPVSVTFPGIEEVDTALWCVEHDFSQSNRHPTYFNGSSTSNASLAGRVGHSKQELPLNSTQPLDYNNERTNVPSPVTAYHNPASAPQYKNMSGAYVSQVGAGSGSYLVNPSHATRNNDNIPSFSTHRHHPSVDHGVSSSSERSRHPAPGSAIVNSNTSRHGNIHYTSNNSSNLSQKSDSCFIKLSSVPSNIQTRDIESFFNSFRVVERSITPHRSKISGPYNDWTVRFVSPEEASNAIYTLKSKMIQLMVTGEKILGYEPDCSGVVNMVLTYNSVTRSLCIEVRSFKSIPKSSSYGVKGLARLKVVLLPHLASKTIKLDPAEIRDKSPNDSLQIYYYFNLAPEKSLKPCNLLITLYFCSKLDKFKTIIGEAFIHLVDVIFNVNGTDNPVRVKLQPIPVSAYNISKQILTWGISPDENTYRLLLGTVYRSDTGRMEIKILKVDFGTQKILIKKSKLLIVAFDSDGKLMGECSFSQLPTTDVSEKYDNNNILTELAMDASYLFSTSNESLFLTLGFTIKLKTIKCKKALNFLSILRPEVGHKTYGNFCIGKYKTNREDEDSANQLEQSYDNADQFIKRWHKFEAP